MELEQDFKILIIALSKSWISISSTIKLMSGLQGVPFFRKKLDEKVLMYAAPPSSMRPQKYTSMDPGNFHLIKGHVYSFIVHHL